MRRGFAIVVALVVATAVVATGARRPAQAAGAVKGIHQTYQGFRYTGAAPPPIAYQDWYFEGTPLDQVTKIAMAPTATFTRIKPTDADSDVQTGASLNAENRDVAGNATMISWQGRYHGVIDGDVALRWFWSSLNPVAQTGGIVEVSFFADPTPGVPGAPMGRGPATIAAGPTPTFNTSSVHVSGVVDRTLVIQARLVYIDASTDMRVSYGSADYPAGFRVPPPRLGPGAQGKPYSVAVPPRGPVLEVEANDVGHKAIEPTIGVANDGTAYFAASDPGGGTAVLRSIDGGREWESVSPTLPTGDREPPDSFDPYIYVDPTTGRVFTIDLYVGCSYMLYSDDRGRTWRRAPLACGKPANDHQTIFTGPPPKGFTTKGYPNVVYYCASQVVDADCGRSFDGGNTWEATPSLAFVGVDPGAGGLCAGYHGHVKVDRQGRIFLPKGHCGFPWVAVSEDAGTTWRQVRVSDKVSASGFHTNVAVDDEGNVYYVWWDNVFKLPWLSVSRDHGRHWGAPLMFAPPGVEAANFPTVVAGNAGRIAINFPGSRSKTRDDFRPWDSYLVVSTSALDRNPVFQSTTANPSSDPIHRGECDGRCLPMLDFLEIVISNRGEAWASAVDTCTDECVGMTGPGPATRGGVATAREGIAVHQVCGPALRGRERGLTGPGCRVAGR